MDENIIVKNDYLKIFSKSQDIFIETYKKGFPAENLNSIFSSHPEIGITSYTVFKNALNKAPRSPEKFAEVKERISLEISDDNMSAVMTLNIPQNQLDTQNRDPLTKEILQILAQEGIVFGIKKEILTGELLPGKPYIIAQGLPPVHGSDSVINMYEMKENKPEVSDDGKVDFYELKLINRVNIGDWLGERIEATNGIPGTNIKGEHVKPLKGKSFPFNYDRNTVQEIFDGTKTTLYARINGAVNYENGRINISNHLEINGDVDLSTGNIKFDGYLSIKGTIVDGFYVEATRDIEINGDLGLGNIKGITSTGGSVYIKGGIISKNKVEIRASKNVYTKFVDNASIISGGSTHIGYYCLNSTINAKEVVLDSSNGQIIGGNITAEFRISAPIIGSEIEKRTILEVTGFDRKSLVYQLDSLVREAGDLKDEQLKIKQLVSQLDEQAQFTAFHHKQYTDSLEKLFGIKEQIKSKEEERKNILNFLKTKGEGEITAGKKIYPNCCLIIKKCVSEISTVTLATSYFVMNGQLKQS